MNTIIAQNVFLEERQDVHRHENGPKRVRRQPVSQVTGQNVEATLHRLNESRNNAQSVLTRHYMQATEGTEFPYVSPYGASV